MGVEDLVGKAKDLFKSEKGEEISDRVLDGAADAINSATGEKFGSQIDGVRDVIDGKVGNE